MALVLVVRNMIMVCLNMCAMCAICAMCVTTDLHNSKMIVKQRNIQSFL